MPNPSNSAQVDETNTVRRSSKVAIAQSSVIDDPKIDNDNCDAEKCTTATGDNKLSRRLIKCTYPSCNHQFHSKCIKFNKKTDEELHNLQFTCDACDIFLGFTVQCTLDKIVEKNIIEQKIDNLLENKLVPFKNANKTKFAELNQKCDVMLQNCRLVVEENVELKKVLKNKSVEMDTISKK
jgi:hypothetical protein